MEVVMPSNFPSRARPARHWVGILGLLLSAQAWAGEPALPLDLDTAGRLALERQPQVAAQEAGIAALKESAVAARQLPDPRLVFGFEGVPVDSFSLTREEMTQTQIGLSQMIPGGRKLDLAGERLERAADQEAQNLAATARRIARDARLAWLEAYVAGAEQILVAGIEAEYGRQLEWAQVAYQTGKLAQDETLALRARQAAVRNAASELQGRQQRARAALARWLGEAAGRPLEPLAARAAPGPLAELEARLHRHPELLAAQQGIDAARTDAELARQAYKPDWSVDVVYGVRGNDRSDLLKLMVGVDLPAFGANRQDRRLAARVAEARQQEAMLEDRRRMLLADLRAAYVDWQTADDRLARLERDILPVSQRRVESALAAYRANQAGYDRVLEARRAELEARQERLNLEVARARAAVMLDYFSE
jgi:outer membrane protein TolC